MGHEPFRFCQHAAFASRVHKAGLVKYMWVLPGANGLGINRRRVTTNGRMPQY